MSKHVVSHTLPPEKRIDALIQVAEEYYGGGTDFEAPLDEAFNDVESSQFKKADASGAHFALIFGSDELQQGLVTVKSLRDGTGQQVQQALADAAQWAATLQSAV